MDSSTGSLHGTRRSLSVLLRAYWAPFRWKWTRRGQSYPLWSVCLKCERSDGLAWDNFKKLGLAARDVCSEEIGIVTWCITITLFASYSLEVTQEPICFLRERG